MAAIILFTLSIWVLSAVIRNADQKRQAARIAQVKAEQARQREELKRQREESKRQARQLDKHEAWLKKHDAEIEKLKTQVKTAKHDFNAERENLQNLGALLDIAEQKQRDAHPGGKDDEKARRQIMTLTKQINAAEKRKMIAKEKYISARKKLEEEEVA